jgi:predicted MFS family arabinose efflux permease
MAMSYTSVWASETFGLGPQGVAMMFVVSGAAGAIGNPLLALASDRVGSRRRFVVGLAIVAAAHRRLYSLRPSRTPATAR